MTGIGTGGCGLKSGRKNIKDTWLKGFIRILSRTLKPLLILVLAFYGFIGVVIGLHWALDVCPFHLATFNHSQVIPIVYGLPSTEMLEMAARREIVLGGCMVGILSAVCPYCKWPARFTFVEPLEVPLDEKSLKEISEGEREEVGR